MDITKETEKYYSEVLQKSSDLKTNACCTLEKIPEHIKDKLKNISKEVKNTYYGCGLVVPDCLKDTKILDLGCGSGRDVFLLSQFVGKDGFVTGIDMTDKQLKLQMKYLEYHMNNFGFVKNNVQFIKGNIELLDELNLEKNYDIVVSNCVINLCKNKENVLKYL